MTLPPIDREFLPPFMAARRAVADRLRGTRRDRPGGADGDPAAEARGRAAGREWAERRAALFELVELVEVAGQVEGVRRGGGGCACFAVRELDRLLGAAAPAEHGPDYRDGFVAGARQVLAEVREFV